MAVNPFKLMAQPKYTKHIPWKITAKKGDTRKYKKNKQNGYVNMTRMSCVRWNK